MAATIQEFLVTLGYKIDENAQRKFTAGLADATTKAVALGAAVVAASAAVVAGVARMATGLEELYYLSERTKSTAENIQAIGFAAGQTGSSVAAMRGSLEGLARTIRASPGVEGLIQSLGVRTRDPGGGMRDLVEQVQALAVATKDLPSHTRIAYFGVLGIDERTMDAITKSVGRFDVQYRTMLRAAGVETPRVTKASTEFMNSLRGMQAGLDILGQRITQEMAGPMAAGMDKLRAFFTENAGGITRGIAAAADIALRFGEALTTMGIAIVGNPEMVKALAVAFGLLLVATRPFLAMFTALVLLWDDWQAKQAGGKSFIDWDKWKPSIDAATAAIGALGRGIKDITGGIDAWKIALGGLALYMGGVWIAAVMKPILGVLGALALVPGSGVTVAAVAGIAAAAGLAYLAVEAVGGTPAKVVTGRAATEGFGTSGIAGPVMAPFVRAWQWLRGGRGEGGSPVVPTGAGGASGRANEAVQYFVDRGWTREQASGIAANLHAESGFRHDAVGDGGKAYGIAQHHPARQADFQRLFNKPIQGSSYQEQLAFIDWELRNTEKRAGASLRASRTPAEAGAAFSRDFERPADQAGAMRARGILAERFHRTLGQPAAGGGHSFEGQSLNSVNQTVTFNVNGSMDGGTAAAIVRDMNRTSEDAVRNNRAAVQ